MATCRRPTTWAPIPTSSNRSISASSWKWPNRSNCSGACSTAPRGDGSMRALYVEDSAADADLARRALRRSAPTLELDVATTLSAARALLDEHAYDVVLLDLGLPDGSGFDFLAELGEAVVSPAVV